MLSNIRIGTRLLWQAIGMFFWFAVLAAAALYYLKDINRTTESEFLSVPALEVEN